MAGIRFGESSTQVLALQKDLKKHFGYKIEASGVMDDATSKAVNDLRSKLGMRQSSANVESATLEAIKQAKIPRVKIVINGKTAFVTQAQLNQIRAVAIKRATEAVRPYVGMANEAMIYWNAHNDTRKSNEFWSSAIELSTGAKFPSKGTMTSAVAAAKAIESGAKAGSLTPDKLNSEGAKIRQAFADMDQYRETMYGGGGELAKQLEGIRDGCIVSVQILAAIVTVGGSAKIQIGVAAGVAAYEEVLKEAGTASKEGSYDIGKGAANVFLAAAVNGTIGLLMKGGKLGKFLDDVAEAAIKKAGSKYLKQYAIRCVNGAAQQMIEDGINGIAGLRDPKKKITYKDFVKAAVESFVKGAGLGIMGPVCSKYGKGAAKNFSASDFKGLVAAKDVKLDKAGEELIKQAIDKVGIRSIEETLKHFTLKQDAKSFEAKVRKTILENPKVKQAAKKAAEQAKKQK